MLTRRRLTGSLTERLILSAVVIKVSGLVNEFERSLAQKLCGAMRLQTPSGMYSGNLSGIQGAFCALAVRRTKEEQ